MIYTTYFSNLKKLPENIVPISIACKAPNGYKGLEYKILAPKYAFFQEWKRSRDNDYYKKCYSEQILRHLDRKKVEDHLYSMSGGMDIALVCYEKPEDFCHRHLVAAWLRAADIPVEEWMG